jgi:hypothetical protein
MSAWSLVLASYLSRQRLNSKVDVENAMDELLCQTMPTGKAFGSIKALRLPLLLLLLLWCHRGFLSFRFVPPFLHAQIEIQIHVRSNFAGV